MSDSGRMRRVAIGGLFLLTACSSGTDAPAITTVELMVANASLLIGQTTQATLHLVDAAGTVLSGRMVTWESSHTSVITVSGTGQSAVLTAVSAGTSTISATTAGHTQSASVTVLVPVVSVTLTLGGTTLGIGQSTQAVGTPRDVGGGGLTGRVVTYSSSNPAVASVNPSSGLVTANAAGLASIGAVSEGQSASVGLMVCQAEFAPPPPSDVTVHVSASNGNNTSGTGSCAEPFQTLTRGLTGVAGGTVVRVAPGTYNATLGEDFPIRLPAGVSLIGDEVNKGQGTVATRVIGGANLTGFPGQPCGTFGTTIYPEAGSVIAGLELTNDLNTFAQMTLLIRSNGITVRNNSIVNKPAGGGSAVYICNGSLNQVITGNRIRDNGVLGLGFIGGGGGARVEQNVIVMNLYGVEYDSPGGDLGGGAANSTGGNLISCNTINDLWTNQNATINAAGNLWDHAPPSGNDIFNSGGAIIVTAGAVLAPAPCP